MAPRALASTSRTDHPRQCAAPPDPSSPGQTLGRDKKTTMVHIWNGWRYTWCWWLALTLLGAALGVRVVLHPPSWILLSLDVGFCCALLVRQAVLMEMWWMFFFFDCCLRPNLITIDWSHLARTQSNSAASLAVLIYCSSLVFKIYILFLWECSLIFFSF